MAEWRSIYGHVREKLMNKTVDVCHSETHESNQPTLEYRPVIPVVNVWYTQQTLKTVSV